MIIFDSMGHMVSTVSADELHAFARRIGLKRAWYQTPGYGEEHAHYDLTTERAKGRAHYFGAEEVHPFELIKRAWWYKQQSDRLSGSKKVDLLLPELRKGE